MTTVKGPGQTSTTRKNPAADGQKQLLDYQQTKWRGKMNKIQPGKKPDRWRDIVKKGKDLRVVNKKSQSPPRRKGEGEKKKKHLKKGNPQKYKGTGGKI